MTLKLSVIYDYVILSVVKMMLLWMKPVSIVFMAFRIKMITQASTGNTVLAVLS